MRHIVYYLVNSVDFFMLKFKKFLNKKSNNYNFVTTNLPFINQIEN